MEAITITTVVLGIDGATWTLLDDWLDELPNLAEVVDTGVSGELESSTPPVTSPAWRCYATGKDPNDIGVYWWRQLDRSREEFVGADRLPLQDDCYWERLSDADMKVGVMGVPLNSPPQEVDGYFISGGPFADPENYTYPKSLSDTLERRFDYQLHPNEYPSIETATNPEIVDDFEDMIEQRFDVAEWMLDEEGLDFLNLTLFYINVMQHKAWDAPEVKRLWKTIDERVGRLLDDEMDLIVHSDHGLHEVHRVFYLNAWLEEQGYLTVEEPTEDRSILDIGRTVTDALGISEQVGRMLPNVIRKRLDPGRRLIDSEDYESRIDFENTRAVGLPQGPVYGVTNDEDFVERLATELNQVTDPESGRNVFESVKFAEDLYANPLREDAPDLLVKWNDGFEIKNQHSDDESVVFGPPHGVVADNAPMGILVASGPSFDQGELEPKMLFDLAPTLLHLLNVPVPEDMTGSVIADIYERGSDPERREVETVSSSTSSDDRFHEAASQDVDERLQDLGYLE